MRLLVCRDCRLIDELPDFDGPPEYDVLLDDLAAQHEYPNGERHFGNLINVEDAQWNDPEYRREILKQIAAKTTGMESEWYACKQTYQEDAMSCYKRHGRPVLAVGCHDYRSGDKRIGNPTKAGWNSSVKVFLCDFCPYQSEVTTEKRWQKGLYKEN